MDEFAELIRREFEEIGAEEERELENMELGLPDGEFQVIKARALNGVIERIRLHQQNEKAAIYKTSFINSGIQSSFTGCNLPFGT